MLRYPPINTNLRSFVKSHKQLLTAARTVKHLMNPTKHNWHVITFEDVFALASDWANILPQDFDCIIGVPRSGLLIANVLASKMNLPLSTTDDFIRGNVWFSKDYTKPSKYRRVLIVEDAISTGRQLRKDIEKLQAYDPDLEIKVACLNGGQTTNEAKNLVDYCYINASEAPAEWYMRDLSRNTILAADFDGVLCDEASGNPLFIPAFPVKAVITARLENQRNETEAWLKEHGVKYNQLIMFQGKIDERTVKKVAMYKAKNALAVGAEWFWESEPDLAQEISGLFKKPVYCPTNRLVYAPKSSWATPFRVRKSN